MRSNSLGFRTDVQGLRAIAVLLVVLYHAGVPWIPGGFIGVDVFFVISGFLITAHLLKELASTGKISFAKFYSRRVMRILPGSMVVLFVSLCAAVAVIPALLLPGIFKEAVATALYAPNLLFARRKTDYLSNPNPSIFQHYWSLGVEEQFYLVWPLALLLIYVIARKSFTRIAVGLALTFAASFIACLVAMHFSQPLAFFLMPFRVWEFTVGGLLALMATTTSFELKPRIAGMTRWLGLGGILFSALIYSGDTDFPGAAAALPVIATGLIILAGTRHAESETSRLVNGLPLLTAGPIVFVGTISYSVYLVHWPILTIPQIAAGDHNPLPLNLTLLLAALCLPVAWMLFRWVETPLRRLQLRPRRVLGATALVTTLMVAGSFAGYGFFGHIALHTNEASPGLIVQKSPIENPVVPVNIRPPIRDASDSVSEVYKLGCHLDGVATQPNPCEFGDDASAPRIVLFGDSHAAQWIPALAPLARRGDIRLTTHTKSSCGAFTPKPTDSCIRWRTNVTQEINASPPDLVLMAGAVGDRTTQMSPGAWENTVGASLDALDPQVEVALLADTPQFNMDVPTCLSKHLQDTNACGATPGLALSPQLASAQRRAADDHHTSTIDLNPYFCSKDWCPVVTANILMYRDAHHVSKEYSRQLTDPLWQELSAVLKKPVEG